MRALLVGASGGLAGALGRRLVAGGWEVDLVTRRRRREVVETAFAADLAAGRCRLAVCETSYAEFAPTRPYDAVFAGTALFDPRPLVAMEGPAIAREVEVGLTQPIRLTRTLLAHDAPRPGHRRDFVFIGSTSAYAGFADTAVYCAVKHGLVGFVRAMNEEYRASDCRFWLFSMGTMATEMGARVTGQDPATYLSPDAVAERIVTAVADPGNLFEPEVTIRRRTIRPAGG